MKVLITGVPGTGKSTISKALNERGVTSIDFSDVPDLCSWEDKITREKVLYTPTNDTKWLDLHERICDIEKLKGILTQYKNIVITGIANGNQTEYFSLFDKIFLLQCSPETVIRRMQTRDTLWGKTEAEREYTLRWQRDFDSLCASYRVIPISTEGALSDVMDKIIARIS